MVLPNSTPSWESSTNSQEGSNSPTSNSGNNTRSQAGSISASSSLAVRWSAKLRASQASRQTVLFPRQIARSPRQVGLCPLIALLPRQLAVLVPRKQVLFPPANNNIQAGNSSGKGNMHSARFRASQAFQGAVLLPRQVALVPKEATLPL